MRRTPFVHPLAIVAALATAAGAADMSKTQLADLKKVSRKIDQVERTVESLEKSKTRGTPAFSDAAASKQKQTERRLPGIEKLFAELPEHPDVAAERGRLDGLLARLAKLTQEGRGQEADRQADAKAWEAHRASPAYQADQELIAGFAVYEDIRFRLGSSDFRGMLDDECLRTLELVAALPEVEARHAQLVERYQAFGDAGRSVLGQLERVEQRLSACAKAMDAAREGGAAHLAELGERLDEASAKVFALRDQARAEGRPFPLGYTLMARTSTCSLLERQIERSADYLAALDPKGASRVERAAERALARYRAAVAQATAEIVASMQAPADDYAGADAAEVKAWVAKAAAGRVHGAKVARVRLSGAWQRTQSHKWDRTAKAWVKVDKSSLAGTLLLEHEGDVYFMRRIEVERDHLRGDALQLFGDFQRYEQPRPDQLLPKGKLQD